MRVARSSGLTGKIISHPSGILLVVQLIGVLIYPFMEDTTPGRVVFEIFGALVLGLAIWSARESPGPTWIVIVLGVLASALSVADAVNHSPTLQGASPTVPGIEPGPGELDCRGERLDRCILTINNAREVQLEV